MPTVGATEAGARGETLVVLLPGRGDRAQAFAEHGFVEAGASDAFDVVAADAHFGYYADRSFIERLHEDVVRPARERGYSRIWLAGISMGGMGAILYTDAHPAMVDGLVLLAPYMGEDALTAAITDAGGLAAWSGESAAGKPYQRRLWRWLQGATGPQGSLPIVLGYGRDDRLAPAANLIADRLPPARVVTTPGGHRWPIWRRLWRRIASGPLKAAIASPGDPPSAAAAQPPGQSRDQGPASSSG